MIRTRRSEGVRTLIFDNAIDLIEHIDPTEGVLEGQKDELTSFLYRGSSSSQYGLVPKILRPEENPAAASFGNLASTILEGGNTIEFEIEALSHFMVDCNSQGLAVPNQEDAFREIIAINAALTGKQPSAQEMIWPPNKCLAVLALAEHHGIATRMLNWTTDPYVALYFAAEGGSRKAIEAKSGDSSETDHIAIWAVPFRLFSKDNYNNLIRLYLPPASDNKNLRAQRAAVTYNLCLIRGKVITDPNPDQVHSLTTIAMKREGLDTAAFKLETPISHSLALLQILARRGYHAGSLFPGYEGIAKLARERQLWSADTVYKDYYLPRLQERQKKKLDALNSIPPE